MSTSKQRTLPELQSLQGWKSNKGIIIVASFMNTVGEKEKRNNKGLRVLVWLGASRGSTLLGAVGLQDDWGCS